MKLTCTGWALLFLKFLFIYLFLFYLWLCWVPASVWGLSLVVASGGHSSSRCVGPSPSRSLLLWSTGSRRTGSVIVAHGPSHSAARGIFPDQGSNPRPLHRQADSQPLRHQGSPSKIIFDPPPRQMEIKTKINKWDLMKLESFCTAKETINKMKDNPRNGRKYLKKRIHVIFSFH